MSTPLITFAHISDTHLHPNPLHTPEYYGQPALAPVYQLIHTLNTFPAPIDFVLHTGDVAQNPENAEHYAVARDVLGRLQYPVRYIPGNHDRIESFQRDFWQRAETDIQPHCDYEFEMNGVQFVMLDSTAPPIPEGVDPEEYNFTIGHLTADQLSWLAGLCDADDARPLVVAVHHHAIPLGAPWLDGIGLENGLALHEILRKAQARIRGVFYGHIHESVVTVRDGVCYYSVQSGWFQTSTWHGAEEPRRDPLANPGFNLVTLTDTETFVRYIRIPL